MAAAAAWGVGILIEPGEATETSLAVISTIAISSGSATLFAAFVAGAAELAAGAAELVAGAAELAAGAGAAAARLNHAKRAIVNAAGELRPRQAS